MMALPTDSSSQRAVVKLTTRGYKADRDGGGGWRALDQHSDQYSHHQSCHRVGQDGVFLEDVPGYPACRPGHDEKTDIWASYGKVNLTIHLNDNMRSCDYFTVIIWRALMKDIDEDPSYLQRVGRRSLTRRGSTQRGTEAKWGAGFCTE